LKTFKLNTSLDKPTLLKIAHLFAETEGTCLLYSGGDLDSAEKSFLFLFPFDHIEIRNEKNPWGLLKSKVNLNTSWVGFLSYEMGMEATENLFPNAYFQQSSITLVVDHQSGISKIIAHNGSNKLSLFANSWIKKLSEIEFWEVFIQSLQEIPTTSTKPLVVNKKLDMLEYFNKVLHIQEMINDGDVYQVNISHEFEFTGERNPFQIFHQLAIINPAPFQCYFNHPDFTIVSSSPERFLKKSDGQLETRPIKGTISRGKTALEDSENAEKLKTCEKNLSELLMITDLMRNDLGKISLPGSVKTLKIAKLEAYTNVYHLLSIIQSIPIPSIHPVDLVKACFPGGSITGCPKIMAMKVIKKLEKRTRGIYTGSIGYFDENGDFDFNIAIRTILFYQNKINIQLGGAITTDSDPEEEYKETMHKGDSIFLSLT